MFYDLTSPHSDLLDQIGQQVGDPANAVSPVSTFKIASASTEIYDMLNIAHLLPQCNIEQRAKGIIVHFQSRGQGMAWVIPYWRLHIQLNEGKLSLFAGEHHMRLENPAGTGVDRDYVAKLYELMAKSTGQDHDIYGALP